MIWLLLILLAYFDLMILLLCLFARLSWWLMWLQRRWQRPKPEDWQNQRSQFWSFEIKPRCPTLIWSSYTLSCNVLFSFYILLSSCVKSQHIVMRWILVCTKELWKQLYEKLARSGRLFVQHGYLVASSSIVHSTATIQWQVTMTHLLFLYEIIPWMCKPLLIFYTIRFMEVERGFQWEFYMMMFQNTYFVFWYFISCFKITHLPF